MIQSKTDLAHSAESSVSAVWSSANLRWIIHICNANGSRRAT